MRKEGVNCAISLEKFKSLFDELANYSQCNGCEVQTFCRSCPAASYALTGSIYNRDPCCWKNI